MFEDSTIVALATPNGVGAIGVVRLSGKNAISIAESVFHGKRLSAQKTHTVHLGTLKDPKTNTLIDEVLATLFKEPKSYTGEDIVEFSCHGSPYVLQQVLTLLIKQGAVLAQPGEFTLRAFLNGKMDLAQAEAVADLIHAESETAHQTAIRQMRGGFSNDLKNLRTQLIDFAALIELENDFSEEDVEFVDRKQLLKLVEEMLKTIQKLIHSFQLGNILKHGVTVVIAGRPNAGKSTLLNALLNEERAIVTNIAGTTRDTIEEKLIVDGIVFRLIDTAGIREATDAIEKIGIEKTFEKIHEASILIYVFDASTSSELEVLEDLQKLKIENQKVLLVANKTDICDEQALGMLYYSIIENFSLDYPWFEVSAVNKKQTDELKEFLPALILNDKINTDQTIVANTRHHAALQDCATHLEAIKEGLVQRISGDLLAFDIRYALHALGTITGEVLHDRDILGSIFSKFCIGK